MSDELMGKVVSIVQDTLRTESNHPELVVTADDTMETVPHWDSLNFMKVFLAINEAFGINPDFDEAIHYTTISTLTEFLRNEVA